MMSRVLFVLFIVWAGLAATPARAQDDPADAPVARAACREGRGVADRCASYSYYLHNGIGVTKDHVQALRYGRMACQRGSGAGCLNAAVILRWSDVVPQNLPDAFELIERGCSLSHPSSCLMLGHMRRDAIGTMVNSTGARQAFNRACALGRGEGCRMEGRILADGFGDVGQDEPGSVATLRTGCGLGDLESCALVGYMSQNGRGMARDADLSIREYMRACAGGVNFACSNIEAIRNRGAGGFGYSELMAREVVARAFPPTLPAEQRFILASAMFQSGDVPLAVSGLEVLAEEGLADANFMLGRLYYSGQGVTADRTRAIRYFERASNRQHPYAKYILAQFNWYAIDMNWNPEWGIALMRGAEEAGLAEAGPIWRQWQAERNAYFDGRDAANRQMALENERSQAAADAANMSRIWGLYSNSQNRQENAQVCGTIYRNNQAHQECMARETFDNYYNPNR